MTKRKAAKAAPARHGCRYVPPASEPVGGVKGGDGAVRVKREWWLRESINDGDGQADIAYVVIGALAVAAIAAQLFIMSMSVVSYVRCLKSIDVGKGGDLVKAFVPCVFDPLPLGQASGLIFAAFAALIGAFAGYMAATRRQSRQQPPAGGLKLTASAEGPG